MTYQLLLPHKYKLWGWCFLIPATLLGLILIYRNFEGFGIKAKVFAILNQEIMSDNELFRIVETDVTNTVVGVLFVVGALIVGFSKEEKEDEFISSLRLSSLVWAVWLNCILLLFCFVFFYGMVFLNVMVYNMFTVLIIFIARFNYILYRSKTMSIEK